MGGRGGALWLMLSQQVPSVTELSRLTLGSAPDCAIHETRSRSRSRFCAESRTLRPLLGSPRESRGGAPKLTLEAAAAKLAAICSNLGAGLGDASRERCLGFSREGMFGSGADYSWGTSAPGAAGAPPMHCTSGIREYYR